MQRTGDIFGMTGQTVTTPVTTAYAPLRWGVHLLVAASIGIVSPFTGFAWPFAIVVGMAMGSANCAEAAWSAGCRRATG